MANLSSYINIAANAVTTSSIVSTTGNVLAANISVTGNVTGSTFLGNLVGTTVSTTGNVSAGNVIVNGQPTTYGVVSPDYINMTTSAAVSVAASGTDLTWDVNNGSSGIAYSAGKFSLTTGKTYHILAELAMQNYSANGYLLVELVDGTSNARIGSQTVTLPYNSGFNEVNNPTLDIVYTPVANQDVKLRVTGGTVGLTAQLRGGGFARMSIVQINPTIAVQATASGTVAATVVANTSPNGSTCSGGSNTAPGLTVLTVAIPTAGTWRLDAELRVDMNSGGYMAAAFYNNGTLIPGSEYWVAGGAQNKASGTGAGQYSGFMSYNVTTTAARTVTLGIWSTATTSVIDSGDGRTWLQATQIDSIFALNTLATMSTTGNVSVGGILSSPQQTKASNATGSVGEICWDATYIYICTATNTWKRVALTGGY